MAKNIGHSLRFIASCRQYNIGLWQCPSFLFIVIGLIIITAILATYFAAQQRQLEPEQIILIVSSLGSILLIIGYIIVNAFEKLARLSQLKTEFVNIVSHQLRTPLSNLKWLISSLDQLADQTAEEKAEIIDNLKRNNQEMINLVNNFLNVSRIEQGGLILRPSQFDLKELIKKAAKKYQPLARASQIKISLQLPLGPAWVWADQPSIQLVLGNLIDNALRYSKPDQKAGWIKISLKAKGKGWRCQIKDNGVGIPLAEQKQIFQKFFRSQNALKYQTEGSGLGLFIAQAIIKASKGRIGFESQEGQGSLFWFELPRGKNSK